MTEKAWRFTMYLRPRRDKDIINLLHEESEEGDYADYCRKLMRDGLKWRAMANTEMIISRQEIIHPTITHAPPKPVVKQDTRSQKLEKL